MDEDQIVDALEAGTDPEADSVEADLGDGDNPYCSPFFCFGGGGGWGVTGR